MNNSESMLPPMLLNIFKPARIGSNDVIRKLKYSLGKKQIKKIGHLGTLDPFASGILLVGINGGQRLNELVHSNCTKTYLAIGKLGVNTPTGDLTSEIDQTDNTEYFKTVISKFNTSEMNKILNEKLLGDYMQAPHAFSAAKFEGRPLYEYARVGITVKKELVKRHIYKINIVKFAFPYLSIEFEVSSGTYIRTLFSDCANILGTIGTLASLVRTNIGEVSFKDSLNLNKVCNLALPLNMENSVDFTKILNFPILSPSEKQLLRLKNGNFISYLEQNKKSDYYWIKSENKIELLAKEEEGNIHPFINF